MSAVTERLKQEHVNIVALLEKVKVQGVNSPYGFKTLASAKQAYLDHLAVEDLEIYPLLKMIAKKDLNLARTLEMFAKEMADISKTALQFFDKYAVGGQAVEFNQDMERMRSLLQERFRSEEAILYREFERLSA